MAECHPTFNTSASAMATSCSTLAAASSRPSRQSHGNGYGSNITGLSAATANGDAADYFCTLIDSHAGSVMDSATLVNRWSVGGKTEQDAGDTDTYTAQFSAGRHLPGHLDWTAIGLIQASGIGRANSHRGDKT